MASEGGPEGRHFRLMGMGHVLQLGAVGVDREGRLVLVVDTRVGPRGGRRAGGCPGWVSRVTDHAWSLEVQLRAGDIGGICCFGVSPLHVSSEL